MESIHLSVQIGREAADVYAFVSQPANLPRWAAGVDIDRTPVEFAPTNDFGVLDHTVFLPTGDTVFVPLRVLPLGHASEVVFTLRRPEGMTDDEFAADRAAVEADLQRLAALLEERNGPAATPGSVPSLS